MRPFRLLGVELRHLAALHAVASEGSFARAARRLGYTQPAISQQIAALERIIGERLFERSGGSRRLALTPAGGILLSHAESIVAQLQAAEADLTAHAAGTTGTLRVGAFQSAGTRIVPSLLRRFREAHPDVDVELRELPSDRDLLEFLQRGDLDLTFVVLPLEVEGPFTARHLLVDPYVLAVSARSPLATAAEPLNLRELTGLSLVELRHRQAYPNEFLRAHGVEPRTVYQTNDNGTLLGFVREGVGAALVPRLMLDPADAGIVELSLGDSLPPRNVGVAWHRDRIRTPAFQTFVDLAATVGEELEAELAATWSKRRRRSA